LKKADEYFITLFLSYDNQVMLDSQDNRQCNLMKYANLRSKKRPVNVLIYN